MCISLKNSCSSLKDLLHALMTPLIVSPGDSMAVQRLVVPSQGHLLPLTSTIIVIRVHRSPLSLSLSLMLSTLVTAVSSMSTIGITA